MHWHGDWWFWSVCVFYHLQPSLRTVTSQSVNASQNIFGSGSACSCDLIVSACDTSCCCDQDCSSVELNTFYCNTNSFSTTSNDVCLTGIDVFSTSLQMCTCPDPSLLCVVTNNDPSSLVFADIAPVTTPAQFSQQLLLHSTPKEAWPTPQSLFPYGSTSFYHVNDPILQDIDGQFEFISLPSPMNTLLCHDGNPITYLSSADVVCARTISASQCGPDTPLDGSAYLHPGIDVLMYPVNLSVSDTLPPAVPLNVSNTTEIATPSYNGSACRNVLKKVEFTFLHNGSGVILAATAVLSFEDVYLATSSHSTVLQRFVVNFVKPNQTEPVVQRSGNPGYVEGAPLLAGNCTGSVALSSDSRTWLTVLESGGSCSQRTSVRFLEDAVTSCQYNVTTESLYKCETNLYPLMAPLVNCVGMYGNSSPLDVSQWVPVLNSTNTGTGGLCEVVTSLHMKILFAYTGSVNNPQAVVVGVQATYGTTNTFSLCRGARCVGLSTALILRTAVTFVDVSETPTVVLKSTTNIVRHLPYDFLYPFFASRGHFMITSLIVPLLTVMDIFMFQLF